MNGHNLHFCDQTTRRARDILHRRLDLDDPADPRARLALDVLIAATRCAFDAWAARTDPPTPASLDAELRAAFAAIPGGLTLAPVLRRTG
ncbi:hypothetical protein [Saccharopolyspora gloriosae]|uniref:hypothetical protein n=1 Tax=Saccharopolyspora gloriosae TaxID=455344 RepID=UPI001FB84FA7|nr:hypothetical protein [Saccharopolyspora gloriosae]